MLVNIDSSQHHSPDRSLERDDSYDPLAEEGDDEENEDTNIEPLPKRMKREKRPDFSIRFDGKNHYPAKENWNNATRCKLEDCKMKSHVYCAKCKVHLCLEPERNCYLKFHQNNKPE